MLYADIMFTLKKEKKNNDKRLIYVFIFYTKSVEERTMSVRFKDSYMGQKLKDLTSELYQLFSTMLERVRQEYDPRDK